MGEKEYGYRQCTATNRASVCEQSFPIHLPIATHPISMISNVSREPTAICKPICDHGNSVFAAKESEFKITFATFIAMHLIQCSIEIY